MNPLPPEVYFPETAIIWLEQNGFGKLKEVKAISGGSIHHSYLFSTTQNRKPFFIKFSKSTPDDMFQCEARGLNLLAEANGPRTPEVISFGENYLILENLGVSREPEGFWEEFGRELAQLHGHTNEHFGLDHSNYIGRTPQDNTWQADGFLFFSESRLMPQARAAHEVGKLSIESVKKVEILVKMLPELVPEQTASLLHGDLWAGNVLCAHNGHAAIIDPAVHYGWPEAELAMTALFGGFPSEFYNAYAEMAQPKPGWKARFEIYNLYHLLNHLNLFGYSYLPQVERTLSHYCG